MLTDQNIDKDSAKYWCLFCNAGSGILNESTMMRIVHPDRDLAHAYRMRDSMTDAQRAASDAVDSLVMANKSSLGAQGKYIIDSMSTADAQKVATQLIADLDANGENAPAMIARELGETFSQPEKLMPDGSKLAVPAAGSNLVKAVAGVEHLSSGRAKSWLGRLWDVMKGWWHSLAGMISQWFFGGKWEEASFLEKLDMLKTGGVHALQLVAIAYLVYKIRGWLFPQLKLAYKNLTAGDDLARCEFNDSNGNSYLCWFDKKKMAWQVKHSRGAKALLHADDVFMTDDQTDAFFATQFFNRFSKQCEAYISPYLDVQRSKQQLQNKDTPDDVKQMLEFIIANASKIRSKMFAGSYAYFNESAA